MRAHSHLSFVVGVEAVQISNCIRNINTMKVVRGCVTHVASQFLFVSIVVVRPVSLAGCEV